jgi:hypothetical protein
MSPTPLERSEHPLLRRNYRVATTAIESFVDLVERCLRVLIPGALVYARPRMGKTHAVEYVCLHLAIENQREGVGRHEEAKERYSQAYCRGTRRSAANQVIVVWKPLETAGW